MARAPAGMEYFAACDEEVGVLFEDFVTALHVWSWMRPCDQPVTVREAADAFGVTYEVIRNAVETSAWMLLQGSDDDLCRQVIDHDGE